MHDRLIRATLVLASSLALFVAPAAAQQPSETPAEPPAQRPVVEDSPDLDAAEERERYLDALFERLADPKARDWERVQSEIIAAWSDSGSPSMNLLFHRAGNAMENHDFDAALVFLDDLTRLAPDFAEGWNRRATIYFQQGEYTASLEDIARTLRLEPRHFGALSGLGIILDRVGDNAGALEAYRRAIAINPHLPGAQEGIKRLTPDVEGRRL